MGFRLTPIIFYMAYTSLNIVNSALIRVGNTPIQTIDDGTKASIAAKARYKQCIRYVLSQRSWACATETVGLSRDVTTPVMATYRFLLPSDMIRPIEWFDANKGAIQNEVEVEGSYALYDFATLYLRYIKDIEGQGLITDELGEVCAAYLAIHLNNTLSGARSNAELRQEYIGELRLAATHDSQSRSLVNYIDDADDSDSFTFLSVRN